MSWSFPTARSARVSGRRRLLTCCQVGVTCAGGGQCHAGIGHHGQTGRCDRITGAWCILTDRIGLKHVCQQRVQESLQGYAKVSC